MPPTNKADRNELLSNQRHVLIVDDDIVTRQMLAKILQHSGYCTHEAGDGKEALAYCSEYTPDIILLDLIMPGMDGYETCRQLREAKQFIELPILILTGLNDVPSIDKALDVGATDFITKPVNWSLLEQRVRYALRSFDMHKSLKGQEARLSQAQRLARIGSWQLQADNGGIELSNELLALLELDESHQYKDLDDFVTYIPLEDQDSFTRMLNNTINNNNPYQIEHRLILPGGKELYVQQQAEIILDADNQPIGVIGALQDITELKSAEALIHHQRYYDTVTDLPNRRMFTEHTLKVIQSDNDDKKLTVIYMMMIENYKVLSETLGHNSVDTISLILAERLRKIDRPNIFIARFNDDTFSIVTREIDGVTDVSNLLDEIFALNSDTISVANQDVYISLSIGVSMYPIDNEDINSIIKGAENAMLRANEEGANQYQFYSEEMNKKSQQRLRIDQELRIAVENGDIIAYYQPQVNIQTGRITGMEALARWLHPERGLIPPFEFIPIAEQNGLIVQVGSCILHEACQQTKLWAEQGLGDLCVGVNLSAKQFSNNNIVKEVFNVLEKTGLPTSQLDLEITESMAVHGMDNVIPALKKFKENGITLSIDDFGTGYSALSLLRELPLDIIKIDRTFVKDIGVDDDGGLAKAIIAMAHSLHMGIIAEGVETIAQHDFMRAHNCESIQGFIYSPPLPANEFEKYVKDYHKLDLKE